MQLVYTHFKYDCFFLRNESELLKIIFQLVNTKFNSNNNNLK